MLGLEERCACLARLDRAHGVVCDGGERGDLDVVDLEVGDDLGGLGPRVRDDRCGRGLAPDLGASMCTLTAMRVRLAISSSGEGSMFSAFGSLWIGNFSPQIGKRDLV